MIHLNDLVSQYQLYGPELEGAVTRVMKSGIYLMGEELMKFEKEFSDYLGVNHVVGVGSGTDALELAARTLNLTKQDEVIVPANAYPTSFGIARIAKLRLADVDPMTLNVSLNSILPSINNSTRAIVVVHLYGMPAPMREIIEFAKSHDLFVIEDCAQSLGAYVNGQSVGTFGDLACFSFYPTKNLGTMGDGGAIVTNSALIADRVRLLRMYGEDVRYHSMEISGHSRLEEIQAAILRVKLKHLNKDLKSRQELADRYRKYLPHNLLIPPILPENLTHANHLFVIRMPSRDKLRRELLKKEIETGVHYPAPIHVQPAFAKLKRRRGSYPISETACREVLSLPFYPGMSLVDQDRVISEILAWK